MVHTVYEAVNKTNGHRYIGSTGRLLETRKKRHFWVAKSGRGARLGFGIRLYGPDSFIFRPLVICLDLDYANYIEKALIGLYKPEYNLQAGGAAVSTYSLSDEAKKKISAAHKGKQFFLGKKHKDETRAKMSEARAIPEEGHPKKGASSGL
jgi:group I intron endonuclease